MRMDIKFVSFILILTVKLLEAKLWKDLSFSRKIMFDYMFSKNSDVVRVRKPEEVRTVNNVTTMDFIGLVERHGYSAEEHFVITKDGYILVIHRISGSPLSKKSRERKKVVFFQHGILCTSDVWVLIGPDKDLAFLLADKGYDIWIGNFRGNAYCRSHIKLSPRNKEFWRYSYHDLGTKDLPAMIDYVLSYTKQKALRYIGHSMGTTTFFTLLSMKPEYNAKIKLGILLAPVAIWEEISPLMEYIRVRVSQIKAFLDFNEIYDLFSLTTKSITMGRTLCADQAITQAFCAALYFLVCGSDPAQLNTTAFPEILSNFPAGIAVQILHNYIQNINAKKFQAYDYGYADDNYKQYGQVTPPIYDLKKVVAPLALYYGANDLLALKRNVLETYKHLPNVILLEENRHTLFNHMDFLWAIDVKTLLYDRVIKLLREFDNVKR